MERRTPFTVTIFILGADLRQPHASEQSQSKRYGAIGVKGLLITVSKEKQNKSKH
jgi:hypothetical protein